MIKHLVVATACVADPSKNVRTIWRSADFCAAGLDTTGVKTYRGPSY